MSYIENPKTKGSGIICAIPQTGTCPQKCSDCFFQSGRSYLEPLDDNLPNLPSLSEAEGRIVRVNDGNDSNYQKTKVIASTNSYKDRFFNTSFKDLDFPAPVVLTLNPAGKTDESFWKIEEIPENLMFVRFRSNTWNIYLLDEAIKYYTEKKVPIILTFMAYYNEEETIPQEHKRYYKFKKRTLNSYWVLTQEGFDLITCHFIDNPYVYTCGKNANTHPCQRCGNCIREYFNTKERMRK